MAKKIYDYEGKKKVTTVRLSNEERSFIDTNFEGVQEFIQFSLARLYIEEKEGKLTRNEIENLVLKK